MASPPLETTPPRVTLFTPDIALGFPTERTDGGPQTAIYVPPGIDEGCPRVNAILWLHGHKDASTAVIEAYLADPRFAFREVLEGRAAPAGAVLVAPTLGPRDECGALAEGATAYLEQVRRVMVRHLGFPEATGWSEVVLACHSGGGKVALQIAEALAAGLARAGGVLAEIWQFDSLYENQPQTPADPEPTAAWWAAFAASHPGTTLRVFHLTTTAHCEYLRAEAERRGLTNVRVAPSDDPVHATVARTHLPACYDAWLGAMAAATPA